MKPLLFFLIIGFLLFGNKVYSQKDSLKTSFLILPFIGYKYQKINTFDLGVRLGIKRTKKDYMISHLSLVAAVDIFKTDNITYAPFLFGLSCYKYIFGPHNGITVGTYFSKFKVQGQSDLIVTPEIGFTLYGLNISYGYNINLDNKDLMFYSKHRLGLRALF